MKIQKKIMKVNYRNGLNGNVLRPLTTLKGLHSLILQYHTAWRTTFKIQELGWDAAQQEWSLPSIQEALGLIPGTT